MNVYLLGGYIFILGIVITVAVYFIYRKFTAGKIVCFFFTKDRTLYRKAIAPGNLNELEFDNHTYVYDEKNIFYTPGGLLKEPKPALIFHID